jgi:CBS domain-containing protein
MLAVPIERYVVETRQVGESATLAHARELLDKGDAELLPVVDDRGRTVGVISRSDLFAAARDSVPPEPGASRPAQGQVREFMTKGPVVVAPSTSVGEAASIMVDKHIHHVCVEEDHRVVGVFGVLGVMQAIVDAEVGLPIKSIMSRPVRSVGADATVADAITELAEHGVSGLAVMDAGAPVGIFGRKEAVRWADRPDARLDRLLVRGCTTLPASTPAHVAAREALRLESRHILVTGEHAASEGAPMLVGIVSGIDLAGAAVMG